MKDEGKKKIPLTDQEKGIELRRRTTEQQSSEIERESSTALKETNAFLKNILDSSSSISIISTDLEANVLFWNKGAENIFGYKAEEMVGRQKINILYPDDETKEIINEINALILKHKRGISREVRELTKDGRKLWIHLNLTPTFDEKGRVVGVLGVGEDITERVEAEETLRNSQQQLYQAQKMESLGALVAGAAHEINNPINLIMYNIPLLQKVWHDFLPVLNEYAERNPVRKYGGLTYDFLDKNLDQLLLDMDMAASRVAKIVTDLKNFARQSNVADKKTMQLNTALENAMRLAQTTLRKSGVFLELDLDPDLPLIKGNLQSIEQIILNIIINAIQAIDHDQGKIKITTGFQNKNGRIYIAISDNGRGVAPSISDKIFDPFVTDKQAEGGTGLGLSVTYSLVKAHEGEISFKSREGKGTTFTVSFPTTLKRNSARILIVDDDKSMRELLAKTLTVDRPYLVDQASNGIEACIRLGTYRPDLLILDMFMPEMDGLEVCRNIRAEPQFSDMKVIVTTGFPEDPNLKELAELGFTNIHYKPFSLTDFLTVVDNILET
jgi:PAS domain S-box-containing protein